MSMDSDIRDIKNALKESERTLNEIKREIPSLKSDIKKLQGSGSSDFFRAAKIAAWTDAIEKISSISNTLNKIERQL